MCSHQSVAGHHAVVSSVVGYLRAHARLFPRTVGAGRCPSTELAVFGGTAAHVIESGMRLPGRAAERGVLGAEVPPIIQMCVL